MSPTNHRHERVGEEIAHEINAMLAGELKDPRLEGMVVVSEVRVQPDMKHARVYVNMRGTSKEQNEAIKAFRTCLRLYSQARSSSVCNYGVCRSCTLPWTFRRSTSSASSSSCGK